MVLVGRYLTRPLMRIIARTGLREVFTGFALLLVVGIALLMTAAGISMALGAFLAGILLAGSEYRHALETDIEPFKGLLMGLFFIAVGMSIDFGLVAHRPLTIAALVLGFTILKGGALRAAGKALGIPPGQRWLFAALLAQGGEFAFVVFGVAGQAQLLPGQWDAILTLVVALSMALTPLALLATDRLAARTGQPARPADAIEPEGARVIIAGFGRFGQIVGRMLFASGVRATVLDHDADQIELLRKFDFRVFYGDATRLDLLHSAGAAEASLLVVAVDDVEASLKLVEIARQHFPNLRHRGARPQRQPLGRAAPARRRAHRARDLRVGAAGRAPRPRAPGHRRLRGPRARRPIPAPQRGEPQRDAAVLRRRDPPALGRQGRPRAAGKAVRRGPRRPGSLRRLVVPRSRPRGARASAFPPAATAPVNPSVEPRPIANRSRAARASPKPSVDASRCREAGVAILGSLSIGTWTRVVQLARRCARSTVGRPP